VKSPDVTLNLDPSARGRSQYKDFSPFFCRFLGTPAVKMAEPIFAPNASDDSVRCKEVPFGDYFATKMILNGNNSSNFSGPYRDLQPN
jgi:hypothetical protein